MNYYERIQKSIDFIESNLDMKIDLNHVAKEAYMSRSNYYRLFFAIAGYRVKEYIRLRRVCVASQELVNMNSKVIDVAIKYDFTSPDSFSKSFKKITGFLPSEFKREKREFNFERIDIMDRYFDIQDEKLLDKYPDIKVLKEIEPMRVAYYCYYGTNPEDGAFKVINEWLRKNEVQIKNGIRIFGYNNPTAASPDQQEYGYEVCVTIDEDMIVDDENIKTKYLEGGLYVVASVKNNGNVDLGTEIMSSWNTFRIWLDDSKYSYGGQQWLEEHLGFDDDNNHIGGVDIYMPICEETSDKTNQYESVEPMLVASYTARGKDAIEKGRRYFFEWATKNGIFNSNNDYRIFAYYDHMKFGRDDFFYKIQITVNNNFECNDDNIVVEDFPGGKYVVRKSVLKRLGFDWEQFIHWVSKSSKYRMGNFWFFEEYLTKEPQLSRDTEVLQYMPISDK